MKLKYSMVEKFKLLKPCEFALLMYLIRLQDEVTAVVTGVYYKDVMKTTGMCKGSFSNAFNALKEKGIIVELPRDKDNKKDHNIYIPGNEWPRKGKDTYKEGYINLNSAVFYSEEFKDMPVHAKYLVLECYRSSHASINYDMKRKKKEWHKSFKDDWGVSIRAIRDYIKKLPAFFKVRSKNGMYYIKYIEEKWNKRASFLPSEEKQYLQHLVRKECWRNNIKNPQPDEVSDVAELITQYREYAGGTLAMINLVMECIKESVRELRYKDRSLEPAYVHKILLGKM